MNSQKQIYLFVLCINNGGSTMLEKILSRCKNASGLSTEGQTLVHRVSQDIMRHQLTPQPIEWSTIKDCIANPNNYNWRKIKQIWHGEWDTSQPVLVQKSPRDLFRAEVIEHNFPNAHFVIMSRNPYSICETGKRVYASAHSLINIFSRKVQHWAECHKAQMANIRATRKNVVIRYEDIVNNPAMVEQQITDFISLLSDVRCSGELSIKPKHPRTIQNMDVQKIGSLTVQDIREINRWLKPHVDTLRFFGYQLIDPDDPNRKYFKPLGE